MNDWIEDMDQDMEFVGKHLSKRNKQRMMQRIVRASNKIIDEYIKQKKADGPTLFD